MHKFSKDECMVKLGKIESERNEHFKENLNVASTCDKLRLTWGGLDVS